MKKLLLILGVVALLLIAWFQYKKSSRVNAPHQFVYPLSDKIDTEYYDQSAVMNYFRGINDLEGYVRGMWYSRDIDVTIPNENDPDALEASRKFSFRKAQLQLLEARLIKSQVYKDKGFDNAQIRQIIESGKIPSAKSTQENIPTFKLGDKGDAVMRIQKKLQKLGFDIPVDGNFQQLTQNAIREFQARNGLPVTGQADPATQKQIEQALSQ